MAGSKQSRSTGTPRNPRRSRATPPRRDGAARTGHTPARTSARRLAPVRYAVVGLGYIAQNAVLPAFAHATRNSALTALISDDPTKRRVLSRRYGVAHAWDYGALDEALASDAFDAVYLAVPNHLHHRFATRAARAGKHVLCEKPMAMTAEECEDIIHESAANHVRLMVGYRLHFEAANLEAVAIAKSGRLGEVRAFESVFGNTVRPGDIRLRRETGGGTLWDLGIYCINAARYLFQDEPLEVFAYDGRSEDPRFHEIEEMTSVVMRFPEGRLASFVSSFGAHDVAEYTLVGTKGRLRVENAYEYATDIRHVLTRGARTATRRFPKRDQFAAELSYFSDCVQRGRDPEPSGVEGLIDVTIIQALYRSIETLKPVEYQGPTRRRRPTLDQEIRRPAVAREPERVHASAPSED